MESTLDIIWHNTIIRRKACFTSNARKESALKNGMEEIRKQRGHTRRAFGAGARVQIVFAALILAFALMQVELHVVLALIGAYLFVVFSLVYYFAKYNKKM